MCDRWCMWIFSWCTVGGKLPCWDDTHVAPSGVCCCFDGLWVHSVLTFLMLWCTGPDALLNHCLTAMSDVCKFLTGLMFECGWCFFWIIHGACHQSAFGQRAGLHHQNANIMDLFKCSCGWPPCIIFRHVLMRPGMSAEWLAPPIGEHFYSNVPCYTKENQNVHYCFMDIFGGHISLSSSQIFNHACFMQIHARHAWIVPRQ